MTNEVSHKSCSFWQGSVARLVWRNVGSKVESQMCYPDVRVVERREEEERCRGVWGVWCACGEEGGGGKMRV